MSSAVAVGEKHSDLLQPVKVGPCVLTNRIVMAPLTRSRAGPDGIPRPLMVEYYEQRSSAGLIIAEGTNISPQGRGYAFTPGIYSEPQVEAWRSITSAVHRRGGHIFVQLWHVGRVSHPSLQPGGILPVAPSAIRPQGTAYTEAGFQPCDDARTKIELWRQDYNDVRPHSAIGERTPMIMFTAHRNIPMGSTAPEALN